MTVLIGTPSFVLVTRAQVHQSYYVDVNWQRTVHSCQRCPKAMAAANTVYLPPLSASQSPVATSRFCPAGVHMSRCLTAVEFLTASSTNRAAAASGSQLSASGQAAPSGLPAPAVSYHHPVHAVNIAAAARPPSLVESDKPEDLVPDVVAPKSPLVPQPTSPTKPHPDFPSSPSEAVKPETITPPPPPPVSPPPPPTTPSDTTSDQVENGSSPVIDSTAPEPPSQSKTTPTSLSDDIITIPGDDKVHNSAQPVPSLPESSQVDKVTSVSPSDKPTTDSLSTGDVVVVNGTTTKGQEDASSDKLLSSPQKEESKQLIDDDQSAGKRPDRVAATKADDSHRRRSSPPPAPPTRHSTLRPRKQSTSVGASRIPQFFFPSGTTRMTKEEIVFEINRVQKELTKVASTNTAESPHKANSLSEQTIPRSAFGSVAKDILDSHPGLHFLQSAQDFHSRYVTTVVARIFFNVNSSWSGRISLAELRRSDFLSVLASLESKEDINLVTQYFSYEHFYVIYCKFWELDEDHDLIISRSDLARHNNYAISEKMIDRIFSGTVTRGTSVKENLMSYSDFVWFLLAEEDKRHPRSIEYWFRCMDLDGDGVLSMYELEYFYSEQLVHMEEMGIDAISFEDCLCQCLDMVKPDLGDKIRLSDLKRCRMCHVFFDTFFNLPKYLQYEQRDPFANLRYLEEGLDQLSDWDRYAGETYEMLVAVDAGNPDEEEDEEDDVVGEQEPGVELVGGAGAGIAGLTSTSPSAGGGPESSPGAGAAVAVN